MRRLLSSKAQRCKDFWKPSKPCHTGIYWISLAEQKSTHCQGLSFFRVFISFCIGKTSHQQHKGYGIFDWKFLLQIGLTFSSFQKIIQFGELCSNLSPFVQSSYKNQLHIIFVNLLIGCRALWIMEFHLRNNRALFVNLRWSCHSLLNLPMLKLNFWKIIFQVYCIILYCPN